MRKGVKTSPREKNTLKEANLEECNDLRPLAGSMVLQDLKLVLLCFDLTLVGWSTPLILALGRQHRQISEFEASLVYRVIFRTWRNPVSKQNKTKKKNENKGQ